MDFTPGMICITGETGAGKSLVVDALSLVLGAKADANMVRQGAKQLEVEALFSLKDQPKVKELLRAFGYEAEGASSSSGNGSSTGIDTGNAARAVRARHSSSTAANEDTGVGGQALSVERISVPDAVIADGAAVSIVKPEQLQRERELQAAAAASAAMQEHALQENAQTLQAMTGDASTTESTVSGDAAADATVNATHHAASATSAAGRVTDSAHVESSADPTASTASASDFADTADEDDDSELILRRIVTAEGKSKAYINGHLATLAQLREIADCLVAIHGQHASIKLMEEKNQLEIVDNFGKLRPLVNEVNAAFAQYSKLRSDLIELSERQKQGAAAYKQDRYELDELKRLDLHKGDYEVLEGKFDRAMHQAQFSVTLASLRNVIEGGDSNIISILRDRLVELDKVKAFDEQICKIMENLENVILYLEDCASMASDLTSAELEMSTTQLEERMSKVHDLARRFACAPQDLYLMTERLERKVADFWGLRDRISSLTNEVKAARQRYEDLAQQLSEQRQVVSADFAKCINEKIGALALPDARFAIELSCDKECKPRLNGRDQLCFMFSANLGQDLKPLAAVASGGELSRLALTIEVLTASVRSTPTLIFDEVDTGISGRTASAVGALLQELGQYVQVITVTHLPQVAAKANTQFVVAKFNEDGQVNSTISALDIKGRIEEISRMIGGDVITDTTRKSAYELLHSNDERQVSAG
ncbi:MAG: DNA repair protein RecN [Candidatus Anaerobiospirillum pullicola]|uniref:DNA repair protein RecN n=1 Tax=Candidatus Anaerobiospirillum pullicola TaxID=2838451 RepID=A0A948TFR1_9GAMM|nr:DNA repair protein RecN [Candidatus Anaerobiospirillum pullicola]